MAVMVSMVTFSSVKPSRGPLGRRLVLGGFSAGGRKREQAKKDNDNYQKVNKK
jgi:hypothetical protein